MSEQNAEYLSEVDGEHTTFHDELLNNLVGEWKVHGTVVGQQVEQDCDVDWILNHQFLELHFVGTKAAESQDPPYEAMVLIGYDNMSERYVAHWLDTFGGRFSEVLGLGTKMEGGSSIKFVFDGLGGLLHNTLSYNPDNSTWHMLIVQKDAKGKWKTFASESFERAGLS
jgi:hypothetical protein